MVEKKSTKAKFTRGQRVTKQIEESKPLCNGKLSDGKACPKTVEVGKTFCRWHDPEDETWREVYARLKKATPEKRTDIVLGLIEDHPEHKLVLPEHDGQKANLKRINLSLGTLLKKKVQFGVEKPSWLTTYSRANLKDANLTGADLTGAYLAGADLQNAHLEQVNLSHASLWNANLSNAYLCSANIENADLGSATLKGTIFNVANLQGVDVHLADFTESNLSDAKLQGVDLSSAGSLSKIYISRAWLDRTRMRREQLNGEIGEEKDGNYSDAKQGYLALKQNFDDLGDYEASSWAYRRERVMEKLEARDIGRAALKKRERRLPKLPWDGVVHMERNLKQALTGYSKYVSDTLIEWLCDYGENGWKVICWMAALLFVVEPLFLSLLGGFGWDYYLAQEYYGLSSPLGKFLYSYWLHILYSLGGLGTANFSGLQPANVAVKLASNLFSLINIFLVGLFGFVAGNRIRRS